MAAPDLVVPIRSKRRARGLLVQKLQHALPSVVLLGDGFNRLTHGEGGTGWWLGIAAATMAVLGLAHGRILTGSERRRSLVVSDAGVSVGGRLFTRFTAPWKDIADVSINAREAVIVTRDGRSRRFDLDDVSNLHEVQPALDEIARRHQSRLNTGTAVQEV